jgi:1-acyl-sn-glycerol-3-phosphate acyltransferase
MRAWGGMPVDRHGASGAVEQIAATMQSRPWCWLGISPEGTRAYRNTLRSGFYFLALRLDLPVGLGYIDFATRRIGCTRFVRMSGDRSRDLALLRDAYRASIGKRPEQASRIAFRDDLDGG